MTQSRTTGPPKSCRQWLLDAAAVLLFLAVLGAVSWRLSSFLLIPGAPSLAEPGLASYRDAIYYPTVAVGDGVNPYDSVRDGNPRRYMHRYPVGSHFPLYSPLILLLHAPLAALPLGSSMLVYAGLNVGLLVVFAGVAIRSCGLRPTVAGVFVLAAALLASQPGRANFNSGQAVLLLSLAACGALGNACRPSLAVASLAILTLKPTFGGPLGLMMIARRQTRVAALGLALGGAIAAIGGGLIFARSGDLSPEGIAAVVHGNHSHFASDPEHHFDETNRVDATAAIERLTGQTLPGALKIWIAGGILALTAGALWRASGQSNRASRRQSSAIDPAKRQGYREADATRSPWETNDVRWSESAGSLTSALAILAMYLCVYHLIYDAVLLAVPALAAAIGRHPSWEQVSRRARWLLAALLLVPLVNVFWTGLFESAVEAAGIPWGADGGPTAAAVFRLVAAANGAALTGAWLVMVRLVAWQPSGENETRTLLNSGERA